ncbi:MAG: hypothetical protein ACKOX4_08355, partial [Bacteroidota bacterium]
MGRSRTNDRSYLWLMLENTAIETLSIPVVGNGRRAQIARLATGLFHRKGYAATSMRELASVSG